MTEISANHNQTWNMQLLNITFDCRNNSGLIIRKIFNDLLILNHRRIVDLNVR